MSQEWTWRSLWSEARMVIADWSIAVALTVAPTDHPDAVRLARVASIYANDCLRAARTQEESESPMTDRTDLRYSRERRRRQIERGVILATEVGHG